MNIIRILIFYLTYQNDKINVLNARHVYNFFILFRVGFYIDIT